MYTNMVDLNKKFTQSSFSIFVMEEPCCFVFGKRGKNILQDGDFFKYSKNYTRKEKSYWKCVIPSCKGRAITSGDFIVEKTQHDHTVDTSVVRARNIETNLIKNSQNLSPRKIIAEIAQKLQVISKNFCVKYKFI